MTLHYLRAQADRPSIQQTYANSSWSLSVMLFELNYQAWSADKFSLAPKLGVCAADHLTELKSLYHSCRNLPDCYFFKGNNGIKSKSSVLLKCTAHPSFSSNGGIFLTLTVWWTIFIIMIRYVYCIKMTV